MNDSDNKLIYKNTIIVYARMIIVTIVGIVSARFVLQALGASDFGLYNVVGGLIAMLTFVSTAMSTTTRRYINVEMGKNDGNLNKVFNISLLIHAGLALLILLLAETIGVWYISNVLNVASGKEEDAMFVFQISSIVACIGLINIPYQSLLEAYEHFSDAAIIDVVTTLIKFGLILVMLVYTGNQLRFYAICICVVTVCSFVLYHYVCYKRWSSVIRLKLYKKSSLYKEILVFNNYTAMGALATIGKSQGGNLLINYFFGTIVNGAFAIAQQIDSYVYMFVSRLTIASNPQIAKNYSGGSRERSNMLMERNSRYSVLIMVIFYFVLVVDIDFILEKWLGTVPEGASLLCILTLTDMLVRSFNEGTNGFIQASGKIKWFQILSSVTLLVNLPVVYVLFKLGFDAYWLIACYVFTSVVYRIGSLLQMKSILNFDIITFVRNAYSRPCLIILILTPVVVLLNQSCFDSFLFHIMKIFIVVVVSSMLVWMIGLEKEEHNMLLSLLLKRK